MCTYTYLHVFSKMTNSLQRSIFCRSVEPEVGVSGVSSPLLVLVWAAGGARVLPAVLLYLCPASLARLRFDPGGWFHRGRFFISAFNVKRSARKVTKS